MSLPLSRVFALAPFVFGVACARTVIGAGGSMTSSSTGKPSTTTATGTTATGTTTTTGSAPPSCGAATCGPGQFCKDTSGACGKGPSTALQCVTKGNVCSDGQYVCGCDGTVYMSEGCAVLAGVSVDAGSHCPPPPFGFFCGGVACPGPSFYCRETAHPDQPGVPTTYGCVPLPSACNGTASCGCLGNCGSGPQPPPCTLDAAGNATQHCFTG